MTRPASAGPMIRPALKFAELSPTALAMCSRPATSETNAWRAGLSNAVPSPKASAIDEDVPGLGDAGDREQSEDGRAQGHPALGDPQDAALVEAVGDEPAVRRQQQHRQELQPGGHADGQGRAVRQLEDQPVLGHALHPRADVGDEGAREVDAVVRLAERGEHAAARAARSQDPAPSVRRRAGRSGWWDVRCPRSRGVDPLEDAHRAAEHLLCRRRRARRCAGPATRNGGGG